MNDTPKTETIEQQPHTRVGAVAGDPATMARLDTESRLADRLMRREYPLASATQRAKLSRAYLMGLRDGRGGR